MIYQFECDEIKECHKCPMYNIECDLCELQQKSVFYDSTPQLKDCPLVAISKTETTSEPCEYCRKPIYLKWNVSFIDGYYKLNDDCNYCPNCGRRLEVD